jgi:hypothetical protein
MSISRWHRHPSVLRCFSPLHLVNNACRRAPLLRTQSRRRHAGPIRQYVRPRPAASRRSPTLAAEAPVLGGLSLLWQVWRWLGQPSSARRPARTEGRALSASGLAPFQPFPAPRLSPAGVFNQSGARASPAGGPGRKFRPSRESPAWRSAGVEPLDGLGASERRPVSFDPKKFPSV